MTTTNYRTRNVQAHTVNGVSAGGVTIVNCTTGYENIMRSSPDGLAGPAIVDREVEFCRGMVTTEDWVHVIDLLTGTVGTLVVYERKSGVAAATGYIKHTWTNPVIHQVRFSSRKGAYATCQYSFECKAADETKGIDDYWTILDDQAAPTYVSAARGGYRIETAQHGGSLDIHHVTAFDLAIAMQLYRANNDTDVGYTCCEAEADGMSVNGSISFESGIVTAGQHLVQDLLEAARGSLVLTLTQGSGAADKTVTLAGVQYLTGRPSMNAGPGFAGHAVDYEVTNDPDTPLTLAGDNKILTIA